MLFNGYFVLLLYVVTVVISCWLYGFYFQLGAVACVGKMTRAKFGLFLLKQCG